MSYIMLKSLIKFWAVYKATIVKGSTHETKEGSEEVSAYIYAHQVKYNFPQWSREAFPPEVVAKSAKYF